MNMHINMSILRTTEDAKKYRDVKRIRVPAVRSHGCSLSPVHLSITHAITNAGRTESKLSRNIICLPKRNFNPIAIQKYKGGLSAYGMPWSVNAKKLPFAMASSAIFK